VIKRDAIVRASVLALALFASSCGGLGGGSGEDSMNLSAHMTVVGGILMSAVTNPGVQSIVLENPSGNPLSLTALVPRTISAGTSVTVIKAGSILCSGQYTSNGFGYAIFGGGGGGWPSSLTSTGALAQDTVIVTNDTIILPINTIGGFAFNGGGVGGVVDVMFQGAFSTSSTSTISLAANGSLNPKDSLGLMSATMTFQGPGSPTGSFSIVSYGTVGTTNNTITVNPGNGGPSPVTATGNINAPEPVFQALQIGYQYSD
jgi:hypothetical protein